MARKKQPRNPAEPRRAVRIEKDGNYITIQILDAKRLSRHGLGAFLEDAVHGEISITQAALNALLRCPYRSGLQGMEVFAGNVLAWGAHTSIAVPLAAVSVHKSEAKKWLQECCIVEEELPEE